MLLTTDKNIKNYTTLLFDYENKYFYHYIFNLYKKIYLKKINYEFNQAGDFSKVKEEFISFTKKDWVLEVTNDEMGKILEEGFQKEQELEKLFLKLKTKYDILHKDYEIEKSKRHNKGILIILAILLGISMINLWKLFF